MDSNIEKGIEKSDKTVVFMENCPFQKNEFGNTCKCSSQCALFIASDAQCSHFVMAEAAVNIALRLGDIAELIRLMRQERGQ